MPSTVPETQPAKTRGASTTLIQDGKLRISLQDAIPLWALENNLVLASFRYNFPIPRRADLSAHQSGRPGQRRSTSASSQTNAERLLGASGGGGRLRETPRVQPQAPAAIVTLHSRGRARPFPFVRPPSSSFQGFVNHNTVTPGGERLPGRHSDPEGKRYRGRFAVHTVVSFRSAPT